jgi:hypothetical protein
LRGNVGREVGGIGILINVSEKENLRLAHFARIEEVLVVDSCFGVRGRGFMDWMDGGVECAPRRGEILTGVSCR